MTSVDPVLLSRYNTNGDAALTPEDFNREAALRFARLGPKQRKEDFENLSPRLQQALIEALYRAVDHARRADGCPAAACYDSYPGLPERRATVLITESRLSVEALKTAGEVEPVAVSSFLFYKFRTTPKFGVKIDLHEILYNIAESSPAVRDRAIGEFRQALGALNLSAGGASSLARMVLDTRIRSTFSRWGVAGYPGPVITD